jgi:hypothetical protein
MEEENSLTKKAASEIENNLLSHTPEHTQSSSLVIKDPILRIAIANACLLIWAILLAVIGMQAVSGKASIVILNIAEALVPSKTANDSTLEKTLRQNLEEKCPKGKEKKKPPKGEEKKKPPSQEPLSQDEVSLLMSDYIEKNYPGKDATSIPPIAIVLDRFQINVNWRDASALKNVNVNKETPGCNDYENLFYIITKRLEAIADFSSQVSVGTNLKDETPTSSI